MCRFKAESYQTGKPQSIYAKSFMLKLVLKLFHHGLGNIDMKFGGGTEQKERVNGKQESLTA